MEFSERLTSALRVDKLGIQCVSIVWWLCVMLLCSPFETLLLVSSEGRRPFYNVAHMVNSIYELEEYLERGANAIESDLTFYENGTVKSIFHGYPCDCYRVCDEKENFAGFLNHVRDLVSPDDGASRKGLTLLFLDLKLSEVTKARRYVAGEELAKYLISHLWNNNHSEPKIHVLLSIGRTSDSDAVRGVRDTFTKSHKEQLLQKLGFDVGMGEDLNAIRTMWSGLGVQSNRWQGDGVTNCLRPFRDDNRLRQAIRIRDSGTGFMDKVYDWTVDLTANIRRSLRSGVDGVLTNFPERVVSVLQENEFKDKYRMATFDDNPFSRIQMLPVKQSFHPPNFNTFVSSARELTIALMGYVWDFYKLRLKRPATLFPLIQEFLARGMLNDRNSWWKRLSHRKQVN